MSWRKNKLSGVFGMIAGGVTAAIPLVAMGTLLNTVPDIAIQATEAMALSTLSSFALASAASVVATGAVVGASVLAGGVAIVAGDKLSHATGKQELRNKPLVTGALIGAAASIFSIFNFSGGAIPAQSDGPVFRISLSDNANDNNLDTTADQTLNHSHLSHQFVPSH